MCGICGVVTHEPEHPLGAPDRVARMRDTMVHRGPDDAGLFHDAHVTLAQRRLSIIDLAGGAQPMPSDDNQIWVLNNGEIYNYRALRRALEARGHRFRTQSDTEAIVYAYREYGTECVNHLRGMFALAVWDAAKRRLFLARDRAGQKPLYYAVTPEGLHFASEIKALVADDALPREIDRQALADYLTYTHIPEPLTLFAHIRKLSPGHTLTYDAATGEMDIRRYWKWNRLQGEPPALTYNEAVEALRDHLMESVRLRMVSDVPLGVLLSGGIDSTAVVAMMAQCSSLPIQTFTIGFDIPAYDERSTARLVAAHFGTDHHEQVLEPEAVETVADKLARQYDEPFADSSMLPTYYVCRMARRHVTVALSGDGGDEVFAGYTRYRLLDRIERRLGWIPLSLRRLALAPALAVLPDGTRGRNLIKQAQMDRAGRYQDRMALFSPRERAALLRPEWHAAPRPVAADLICAAGAEAPYVAAMQHTDMHFYLPSDILVKTDRASMLNSLEVRAPMLDHRLLEFAGTLPMEWVMGKRILRDAIRPLAPTAIFEHPKTGFGVPLGAWFTGDYQSYLRAVLLDPGAKLRAYLRPEGIMAQFRQLAYPSYAGYKLWALLMLELWAQAYAG